MRQLWQGGGKEDNMNICNKYVRWFTIDMQHAKRTQVIEKAIRDEAPRYLIDR